MLSKLAAKKTAGVLGDDLALNAQQVTGVNADRELPVVWAVSGSLVNKAILVPAALAISAVLPMLITLLLMLGGAFLCFEGFEKLAHRFLHRCARGRSHHAELAKGWPIRRSTCRAFERDKIRGAVRTDFILSARSSPSRSARSPMPLATQAAVLAGIALVMTVGGRRGGRHRQARRPRPVAEPARRRRARAGRGILAAAPWLMKLLSIAGTAAMFLVGGGILVHRPATSHHAVQGLGRRPRPLAAALLPTLADGLGHRRRRAGAGRGDARAAHPAARGVNCATPHGAAPRVSGWRGVRPE